MMMKSSYIKLSRVIQAHHIYRLIFLILKLIPAIALPQYMDVEDIGTYGAVIGYVYLISFFSGYELWYYHNRNFVSSDKLEDKQKVIEKQFGMYFYTYIPSIIAAAMVGAGYSNSMLLYIPTLTIITHLSQENSRILICLARHKDSAILQCIQSLWVLAFPFNIISDVESVFLLILLSSLASLIYSYARVYKYIDIFPNPFKFAPISNFSGLIKPSTYLLVTVLCMKLYLYLPRIFLEESGYSLEAGIFTYFQNLATISDYFVQYFVVAVYTPKLIANRDKGLEFKTITSNFFKMNSCISVGVAIMTAIFGYVYIFYFLSNEVYENHFFAFLCLVAINSLVAVSGFYATMLYVMCEDKLYRFSMIYSLAIAVMFMATMYYANVNIDKLATTLLVMGIYALSLLLVRLYYYSRVK